MVPGVIPAPTATLSSETAVERARRVAREADILARAKRDIDAGFGIEDDEMEAWLESLDQTDPTAEPSPEPARRF